MGVPRFQADAEAWDHAVGEAAGRFRRAHPSAVVFHEIRDDWRRTVVEGRPAARIRTRSSGMRFEPGGDGSPEFWVAAPEEGAFRRLWETGAPSPDPLDLLNRFELPPEFGETRIHAAAFRQTVRVGLADGTVRRDVREGAWVRIDAAHGPPGGRGSAVAEVVLRADPGPDIRNAVIAAKERARVRVGAVPVDPGVTRAVFAPGVGGLLIHELVGHALEGDVVAANRSWLGEAGRRAGPEPMTVSDDPGRSRGAWRIDDEGVDTRPTVLVEGGRVAGALLDRASARALGRSSTGHGRRATFRDPVLPRMGATILEAGEDEDGAALADTSRGVYILRMSGRSDPARGTAVFRVTDADAIDQGRRTHPVQPFVLVVAASGAPLPIDRIGREIVFDACIGSCHRAGQPLATSVGAPTFRLGSIRVLPWSAEST